MSGARTVAGLARRTLAGLVDLALLVAIGAALTFALFDPLARLGTGGQAVGFAVATLYFGLFDGRVGHGASPGKRLLRLAIVDRDGALLPVWRASLRAAIFAAPLLCNGAGWLFELDAEPVVAALANLGGVVLLATVALLLFNARTRQGLHDVAVGAYVVRGAGAPTPTGVPRAALIATACLAVLVPVTLGAIRPARVQDATAEAERAQLERATRALWQRPDLVRAYVALSQPSDEPAPVLVAWVWLDHPVTDANALAATVAATVRATAPDLAQGKELRVRLIRTVSLGLFFYTRQNQLVPGL